MRGKDAGIREDYPRTLMEFERAFSNEKACQEYVRKLRWPQGFKCPGCGGKEAWETKRGTFFCRHCKRQTSMTAGTVFDRSKQPLELWFRAVWLITTEKTGISALGLQRQLGIRRYETTWMMLRKLRRAMVRPGRELLKGRVEVDETFLGAPAPGKRGRGAEKKVLVIIAAEVDGRKTGRIRMKRIPDAGGPALKSFILHHVEKGSTIITDGYRGYSGMETQGYLHERIPGESVAVEELLPRVHRVASLLKRWLLGTHQGGIQAHKDLDPYLEEFSFRFNRRTSRERGKLFYRLIEQAVRTAP